MSVHLTNTFFLLGALTFTASAASFGTRPTLRTRSGLPVVIAAALLLLAGITGAISALGDTLFPATSLAHGVSQDLAPSAHFLIRLRVIHPIFAVGAAVLLWFGASRIAHSTSLGRLARICRGFQLALVVQLVIGVINLLLLVPLWTQLLHLLGADVVVITFGLLAAQVLTPDARQRE